MSREVLVTGKESASKPQFIASLNGEVDPRKFGASTDTTRTKTNIYTD
jgi:hypothetical protein